MATYFSNLIGADGTTDTVIEVGKRPAPGQYGTQLKIARAFAIITPAAADVIRYMTLPSGVRIHHIYWFSTDSGTTGLWDLGCHKAGAAHDGAVIDADLFASLLDTGAGAIARTDQFLESATFAEVDRGKYFWQLADLGAATLTTDPFEDWDITATVSTSTGPASTTSGVEVWYS